MLVVSTREFRQNQRSYLDQIDNGVELLLQRGSNKCYKIMPITDDDAIIDKEYILTPDEDLARAITGEELLKKIIPRIEKLFDK